MRSLALALAAVLALTTAGWAAPRAAPAIPCNLAIDKLRPDCRGQPGVAGGEAGSKLMQVLAKPLQELADFISGDLEGALALTTEIPDLQDGHLQQCLFKARSFNAVLAKHPVPLTLHALTDLAAIRLLVASARRVCGDAHCSQVFADLANGIQVAAPVNFSIPVPTLNAICAKVPQIELVPTIADPAPPAPAPPAQ